MGYAIYGVWSNLLIFELDALVLCFIVINYGFVIIGKSYVRLIL